MLHNRKGGEEMTEVKKKVLSFLSGLLATFLKLYGAIFGLVCIVMIIDVVTGVISSKVRGISISSKKANQGFWKKMGLLLSLMFGVFLDAFIPVALGFIDITIPFNMPFGLIFGCYIVFNEGISICENLDNINPSMLPHWVKSLLKGGADKFDEAANSNDDEKK